MTALSRLQPRSLWSRRPRHEETADSVQFAVAAQERGPWPLVLVVELLQLVGDIFRRP